MTVIESAIESLLPRLLKVADQHASENVSNAAALAADALMLLLDLDAAERRVAVVTPAA